MTDLAPDGYIQIKQASRFPDRPDVNMRILFRNIVSWSISDGCLCVKFSDRIDYYPLATGFSFSVYYNSDGTCAATPTPQDEPRGWYHPDGGYCGHGDTAQCGATWHGVHYRTPVTSTPTPQDEIMDCGCQGQCPEHNPLTPAPEAATEIVPTCGCGRPAIRHDDGLYSVCSQCKPRATEQRLRAALLQIRSIGAQSGTNLNAWNAAFDVIDHALTPADQPKEKQDGNK